MEIITFENKTWQEIPDQDNPAMHYYVHKEARPEECIMIYKSNYPQVHKDGFTVAHVPLEGDITKKGCFWNIENAELFAAALNVFLVSLSLKGDS